MDFVIYPDGSYDIVCCICNSETILLKSCYPALDGVPLRPLSVEVSENAITYSLISGEIKLFFVSKCGSVEIASEYKGINPHDFSYFGSAALCSCEKIFCQGEGMGGPSGFHNLTEAGSFNSFGVAAFGSNDFAGVIYFNDYHIFRSHFKIQNSHITALTDTEYVLDGTKPLPSLIITTRQTFDEALRVFSENTAATMNARKVTETAFHWCSWYYLYQNLDQNILEEYLEGFSKYKESIPFSHIQIDAGYFPSCGDWLDLSSRFPKGLKYAADTIKKYGYEPGIWIGPYMVGDESKLYKEHPDWILRKKDGSPVNPWQFYNEPKVWGFRDCDYYVLDISHPDAMAYIRFVFRTLHEWGYTLFKTDFLFWGLVDSSEVVRHTPGKTSVEYFRMLMEAIREEIGESRWLGCIAPFLPSIGYVDMMRIGGDVGSKWDPNSFGPVNMINEITADQYFNNVFWQNDPDAYMLRDFHIYIEDKQIEALVLLAAMSGGTVYTSDPIHQIAKNRRDLLSFVKPAEPVKAEYPAWQENRKDTLIVNKREHGTLIYWFNGTPDEIYETPDWCSLSGNTAEFIREYHGNTYSKNELSYVRIAPRTGRLFFVTDTELEKEPDNLWIW